MKFTRLFALFTIAFLFFECAKKEISVKDPITQEKIDSKPDEEELEQEEVEGSNPEDPDPEEGNSEEPSHQVLRKPSYNVQNGSLFDFEFTTDTNYVFRESVWRAPYNRNIETIWSVVSPFDENPKFNELPENLSTAFPNLDLKNVYHSRTVFRLRSISYSEFIQSSFDMNANPLSSIYELESYTVQD